jgi:hypothetical protein
MLASLKRYIKLLRIRQLLQVERRKRANLPARFDGLPPDLWDLSITDNGHLACSEVDLVDMAQKYGTPLHVVNRPRLIKDYSSFVGAFRRHLPKVELATSYKTNPLPAVLTALHRAGTWAEVISPFELWLALELKVAPEKIVLNGPGKGRESPPRHRINQHRWTGRNPMGGGKFPALGASATCGCARRYVGGMVIAIWDANRYRRVAGRVCRDIKASRALALRDSRASGNGNKECGCLRPRNQGGSAVFARAADTARYSNHMLRFWRWLRCAHGEVNRRVGRTHDLAGLSCSYADPRRLPQAC